MTHRVREELQAPLRAAVTKAQVSEGGCNCDGDLINGCANCYLEGGSPLRLVCSVASEALKGCACIPRAEGKPEVVWCFCQDSTHFVMVGVGPPGKCVVEAVPVCWHLQYWSWVGRLPYACA